MKPSGWRRHRRAAAAAVCLATAGAAVFIITSRAEITGPNPPGRYDLLITGGMVIDFAQLKQSIKEGLSHFDHKTLNDLLEYPSVENICQAIKEKLGETIHFPFTLRVWEGHGKWVEM